MYSLENAISAGLMDEVVDQDILMKSMESSGFINYGTSSYSMIKELFIADALKKLMTVLATYKNHR